MIYWKPSPSYVLLFPTRTRKWSHGGQMRQMSSHFTITIASWLSWKKRVTQKSLQNINILTRRVGSKADEEKDERRKRRRKQGNRRKSNSTKSERPMKQVDQMTNILTGGKVQYNNNSKTSSLLIANTCGSIPSCCTQVYNKEGCFRWNVHGIFKGNAHTDSTTKETEIAAS